MSSKPTPMFSSMPFFSKNSTILHFSVERNRRNLKQHNNMFFFLDSIVDASEVLDISRGKQLQKVMLNHGTLKRETAETPEVWKLVKRNHLQVFHVSFV